MAATNDRGTMAHRRGWRICLLAAVCAALVLPGAAHGFVAFESGQVRPLVMAPDGSRLFAVNTPDGYLEIFDVQAGGLSHRDSVRVGLEPVAVAARNGTEVWVVNHLSDSVSIVDVAATPPRVTATLLVGDEPRDIVFAGPGGERAFITTAHRGQNSPYTDPANPGELTTPGIGRADVWVFDATDLGAGPGGTPLAIVTLFGDTPRALAVSPDGGTVYAAVFHSGNQSTTVHEGAVCDGGAGAASCTVDGSTAPGGLPPPNQSTGSVAQPEVGLIVKYDAAHWVDELDRHWDGLVRFDLPDLDVFAIDADADPPVEVDAYAHVGTVLFDMAVHPVTGKVYVSNTEAVNQVRFEGSRQAGDLTSTVQGHLHETRLSIIDPATGSVTPRHLNKHIDYSVRPAPAGTKDTSLGLPRSVVLSGDGATLYLAAKGSDKVGVFATAQIDDDSFVPSAASHIAVSGGGPSGLALDEVRNRLYVTTRFDNGISILDTVTKTEVGHYALHNPEPASVVDGRRFLYDANLTSSNGEVACASCHVDGDFDSLGWDLGDPTGTVINNPGPFLIGGGFPGEDYHPMKGPMTTQTLRGLAGHGAMHWRGDRTGGNDEASVQPDGGTFNEELAFKKFIVAFEGLNGAAAPITDAQMQLFADFMLQVTLPPNPNRNLDDSLTTDQQAGHDFYFGPISDGVFNCNGCHVLDPPNGFFGTDGRSTFDAETQFLKVAHLRNLYTKVGMFGMPAVPFFNAGDNGHKGDQIRGFGFLHDGSTDTLFRFLHAAAFNFPQGDTQRRQVEQFLLAYDSNLKPVVGQQITSTSANRAVTDPRLDLLIARAAAGDCDLVVTAVIAGEIRGGLRLADGTFETDKAADAPLTEVVVRDLVQAFNTALTFTAVPLGTGTLSGIDRDDDGVLNGDDVCPAVADPAQVDTDGDGAGDACDEDDDGDGVPDAIDAFPMDPAASVDTDGDGDPDGWNPGYTAGDTTTGLIEDLDDDGDGEPDTSDNCPLVPNVDQSDCDGDGIGDVCDPDFPVCIILGDLAPRGMPNQVLNVADLLILVRLVEGLAVPTSEELVAGDLNGDDLLDVRDVLALMTALGF